MSTHGAKQIAWFANNAQPSLDLNFLSGALDPSITFTRAAGAATYFDATGTLQNAGTNVARFDYDPVTHIPLGLLIEEARTNICLQSGFASGWSTFGAVTLTANAAAGLDGGTTAASVFASSTANAIRLINTVFFTTTGNVAYTVSAYLKASASGQNGYIQVNGTGNGAVAIAYFDLTAGTGVVGADIVAGITGKSVTIVSAGNGWWRVSFTFTTRAADTTTEVNVGICSVVSTSNDNRSYVGIVGQGIYAFGPQLELGAFVTSYIPTTGSTATRAVDVAQITSISAAPWFNASAGTIAVEFDYLNPAKPVAGFSDGSTANMVYPRSDGQCIAAVATVSKSVTAGAAAISVVNKLAESYRSGSFSGSLNGAAPVTDNTLASGPFLWTTRMTLGCSPWGLDNQIDGHLRRVRYWSQALRTDQLQQVTV